eukprot:CAMPEP_0197026516 /NCGR_PEP_ID=MMETSP1384-20130603/6581_1 /TAXON_ID=29189 /ORGANISM="Ammonia sp." /LENGTH=655 /DNA_ID=CAMNT_0042455197 /DNA_START=118 /DNA_END=2085 /DNA_ORIENTATION=-
MQYHNQTHTDSYNRQPLQYIENQAQHSADNLLFYQHHEHELASHAYHKSNSSHAHFLNENMDPSQQQQILREMKSANNNNHEHIHASCSQPMHANKQHNNLYLRRHQKCQNQSTCNNNNSTVSAPQLRLEVVSNESTDLYSANSVASYTTTNEHFLLSSASSMQSASTTGIANAYYSNSSANGSLPVPDSELNKAPHSSHSSQSRQHKKKKSSLFRKISDFVSNRRASKEVDEDGDVMLSHNHGHTASAANNSDAKNAKNNKNDSEMDTECQQREKAQHSELDEDGDDEAEFEAELHDERDTLQREDMEQDMDATEGEESGKEVHIESGQVAGMMMNADGTYTPSTGNTPLLVKTKTPYQSMEKYSREMIDAMIGADTFVSDYLQELLCEEKKTNSLQWYKKDKVAAMKKRRDTIDWLCGVGVNYGLQRSTIYRCIYYFDKLCSEKQVNVCHLQMIAAICLLIAIKWNEKEEKVPSLYKLSKSCNKQYSPNQFKPMEVKILDLLSFRLKVVLPIDFVSYYIERGCVFPDDQLDGHCNLQVNKQTNVYLFKYAIFFLDVITQNYSFWQYLPSVVAVSVIVASRRALRIEPYFNGQLTDLCKYHPSQIKQCFDEIWSEYRSKYANDAKRTEKLQPHGLEHYFVDAQQSTHSQIRHSV